MATAATTFPLAEARLLGAFAESLAYGIYLVTCVKCCKTFFSTQNQDHPFQRVKWVMLIISVILFAISTLHLSLNYYQIIVAFVFYTGPAGPIGLFSDITTWDNVLSSVLVILQCTIGDVLPIYRCYILYNRSWKVIVPSIILYLGGCSCTIHLVYIQATLRSTNLINIKLLVPEATAFWAITTALNIINTSLLVFCIWRVNHRLEKSTSTSITNSSRQSATKNRLDAIMRIIAGSGLLYTLVALLTLIAEARGSVVGYPLTDIAVVTVGIAFNLIVTLSAKLSRNDTTHKSSPSSGGVYTSTPLQTPTSATFGPISSRLTKTSSWSANSLASVGKPWSKPGYAESLRLSRSNTVLNFDDSHIPPLPTSPTSIITFTTETQTLHETV